jgi:hypothetical protein
VDDWWRRHRSIVLKQKGHRDHRPVAIYVRHEVLGSDHPRFGNLNPFVACLVMNFAECLCTVPAAEDQGKAVIIAIATLWVCLTAL